MKGWIKDDRKFDLIRFIKRVLYLVLVLPGIVLLLLFFSSWLAL